MNPFKLIAGLLLASFVSNSQITFSNRYSATNTGFSSGPVLNKFALSGYKYVWFNNSTKTILIYNPNHSLYKSITVPNTTMTNGNVSYITETLFDNDNQIEYVYAGGTGTGINYMPKVYIYKENGTQVFFRDSAQMQSSTTFNQAVNNYEPIFFDGSKTVMRLAIGYTTLGYEYYDLPGTLPCIQCGANGPTSAKTELPNETEPVFYPNPANDQLKLKYELPKDYKTAYVKVQDMQGKEIETFRVTNDFSFIYLPKDYNNGLYIYSLIVDDKVVKREKIVLSK